MEDQSLEQVKLIIWIKGHIDQNWSRWFTGLEIQHTEKGLSKIYGNLQDQTAFFGCLLLIRDLGLEILKMEAKLKEVG